jgi:hypothetical protein
LLGTIVEDASYLLGVHLRFVVFDSNEEFSYHLDDLAVHICPLDRGVLSLELLDEFAEMDLRQFLTIVHDSEMVLVERV